MDMDHLIGQRFNLISKSEIRYVGTLHEINPEQSTIALENVFSFGTEDRKVDKFIPPSQQKYGFIVFRGSDVKDIKIAEDEPSQPSPPQSMPNDPAILNASRPGPPPGMPRDGPFSPQDYPHPPPPFGGYYPPNQFGRGYGPPPGAFGPGPGFPPYGPPPPGYFGPPGGQGFPQGPGPHPFPQHPQPPIGPPGLRGDVPPPHMQSQPPPDSAMSAAQPPPNLTSELPGSNKAPEAGASPLPKETQPSTSLSSQLSHAQVAAKAAPIPAPAPQAAGVAPPKAAPTGPKNNRVAPAVPFTVNQKSFTPPVAATADTSATNGTGAKPQKPAPSQAAMDEAARQAKEAVAAAMAKLNPQAASVQPKQTLPTAAVDALTKKVAEMSTSATNNGTARGGRAGFRGGRGGNYHRGGGQKKMEIPKSDFDFESANAKFNKEDLIKEAIASGSPLEETPAQEEENGEARKPTPTRKDSLTNTVPAYNKSTSFFDNISSEAKDREEGHDGRAHGRQVRSEEFKKNIETFGQGNVDGGYRGRGRGGGYGRGRQYGGSYRGGYNNRGYGGGYNHRGNRGRGGQGQGQGQTQAPTGQAAVQN
ncbi:hypothetical protein Z517_06032 [Fonsecaea pedrosoi CBS 271.37]|uniref:Unplaced genomic scaffold supercont1.4, whole genome shotgun sequence n=1 Tax=Fonsecaea pedrosoi CBS 271.37 TaxID=1442368 RepID=A0A0D2GLQ2_9EURO|nr:uncharacterized protein Z517_06032 [Fonsecaea pedrosoi CBS 271.37]KIW79420.1 hypothetical protein Z517_06032 [Fonsecaea pedrosoi CBS 271.37]